MAAALPTVSIVTPIHNGGPHYAVCFQSLADLDYPWQQLEIIIVDDASTDGTREMLRSSVHLDHLRILYPPTNLGRSGVRNLGLADATGDIVILLDGDMQVSPDFIFKHVAELAKPGRVAVLGQVLPAPWVRRTRLQRYLYEYPRRGAGQFGTQSPIGFQYLLTHNLALKRDALKAGGAFDEAFVHYGGEDTLFAYRIARAFPNGLFYATAPTAWHHHSRTLGQHLRFAGDYGYHNLPRIMAQHPEIAVPLAADFAWPLPGPYFRRKRRLGTLLFNRLTVGLMRLLAVIVPVPVSHGVIRFLTVAAVVRGLRQFVRRQRPERVTIVTSGGSGG